MRGGWNPFPRLFRGPAPPPPRPDRERLARFRPPRADREDSARSPALARLEAALFAADRPLSPGRLAKAANLVDAKAARELIAELTAALDADRSPFRVEKLASGYRLMTRTQYAPWLSRLHARKPGVGLSPTAMETLTIIAYRQPLTRADVEAVRGVQSLEVIKQLADRGFVRIVGEDESLGRPFLYGTTPLFLERFDLGRVEDLPDYDTLSVPIGKQATGEPAVGEHEASASETGA